MIIKGLQKTSLVDFPGRISSIIFLFGCNLRCGFCHNPDLVFNNNSESINAGYVIDFLQKRSSLIEGVVVTGGEPAISAGLESFLQKIRDLSLQIKLDTNGLNPGIIGLLLKNNLIDYLAIDVKTSPGKYKKLTGVDVDFESIKTTIDLAREAGTDYEIRTTCVPGFVDMNDLEIIKHEIGIVKKYYLQQFVNSVEMVDPAFKDLQPYKKETMYKFREFVTGFSEVCEVRGI